MLKAGITGGIGSGKTIVCRVFELLGIPVYYSDLHAKQILHSKEVTAQVTEKFGKDVLDASGVIDRKKLSALVFGNKQKLDELNAIIHPAVGKHFTEWVEANRHAPYILKEAAILFESGANKQVDVVIVVSTPEELRIERAMKRDRLTREEVMMRISNQMDERERVKKADHVIRNNEQEFMIPQVLALDKLFRSHK